MRSGSIAVAAFSQIASPFEHRAITEALCVSQQLVDVPIFAIEVRRQAVGNVLDASADLRVVEHIDDRPVHVRYGDLGASAPDRLRAQRSCPPECASGEVGAMALLSLPAHRAPGHHDNVSEYLFR